MRIWFVDKIAEKNRRNICSLKDETISKSSLSLPSFAFILVLFIFRILIKFNSFEFSFVSYITNIFSYNILADIVISLYMN